MGIARRAVADRTVYLSLGGVAAAGILPAQVACKYKKTGDSQLRTKILDSTNWINLGQGYYTVRFSAQDTDVSGYFFYTLSGTGFDNFTSGEFVIEPESIFQSIQAPEICIVSGSVRTVGNSVPKDVRAVFRPVQFPAASSGNIISATAIVANLTAYGTFSAALIQGSTVIVEIDGTGIRGQIIVPYEATADLMSLLPPLSVTF